MSPKVVFIVLLTTIVGLGVVLQNQIQSRGKVRVVKTSFPDDGGMFRLDTAKLSDLSKYVLAKNLYSTLIEYDELGNIVPNLVESFSWNDKEIKFQFSDKVKSKDGGTVSAQDAEFSLKRMIFLDSGAHGSLANFLCPGIKLNSIRDICPGIETIENLLILRPSDPKAIPLLISSLDNADYSIVPIKSVDLTKKDLPIVDRSNTSGPYFVSSVVTDKELVLEANPNHFKYSEEMPKKVLIRIATDFESYDLFSKGELNFLTTATNFVGDSAANIIENKQNVVHQTLPLKVAMVRFSKSARDRLSNTDRFYIANRISNALSKAYTRFKGKKVEQLLQSLSEGALNQTQMNEIESLRKIPQNYKLKSAVSIGISERFKEVFTKELIDDPNLKVLSSPTSAFFLPEDQKPDAFFMTMDTAWNENLSLIGHAISSKVFYLPGVDLEKWLQNYSSQDQKETRIKNLNELHFAVIKEAMFVPLEVMPYFTVSNENWELNQSNISTGTNFWKIRIP